MKAKMRDLGGAPEHYKETWIYFARRLRELDEFDAQGALANCKYFIHEGVCTLHLKKYPDAYEILKVAAKHYGDEFPARYWGYFGDAALAVKEYGKANNAYLKLLTINPFEIDWATLQKKLRSVFKQLAEDGSIALAYANLPYFAWREEIIEVPQGDTFITEFVQKLTITLINTII
ncbi:MAG: hypothetical protein H6696_17565 [Deferribacteres bacterium]|nr:hypothetical protein [Deferribacteres bacterium]